MWSNNEIAACLDTRPEMVSLWRKRFFTDRLAGLEEQARPGREAQLGFRRFQIRLQKTVGSVLQSITDGLPEVSSTPRRH
jgi:hypothetical protein